MATDSPLRPVEFQILLTLVEGERHGYAIIQDTAARTQGDVQLETATLYRALKRLVEGGLVVPGPRRPARDMGDERRHYYRITAAGHHAARAEAARLHRLVSWARDVRLLPEFEP